VLEVRVRRRLRTLDLDVAFSAAAGTLVLFGPSGAGKSLTLRIIAGIEPVDSGLIRVSDRTLLDTSSGILLPPQQRRIGYVPQQYALFPHLTALENVTFPLRRAFRWPRRQAEARATELLASFGLADHLQAHPAHLSGGQQQRVALARALAIQPDVLLLDEPFSALDTPTRLELRTELRRLQRQAGIPVLFVTHDLEEAATLGDRMAVVIDGRIRQQDLVRSVLDAPADRDVAELVQSRNMLPGIFRNRDGQARVDGAGWTIAVEEQEQRDGASVYAVIRPESIDLARDNQCSPDRLLMPEMRGVVVDLIDRGAWVVVVVQVADARVEVSRSPLEVERLGLTPGIDVRLSVPKGSVHLIPRDA
jgi:molybdate transport system ATP-binding protein